MRRVPSLTFDGALKILGSYEPKWIERLDQLLGGAIIAAGAAAGVAAMGPPELAPLGMFAAVWGWMGNKDAAVDLLKQAVGRVSGRIGRTEGYERRQLIAAAHTTIVLSAFFEALQQIIGAGTIGSLQITDAQKIELVTGRTTSARGSIYECIYTEEIPSPWATGGFQETQGVLAAWYADLAMIFSAFIESTRQKKFHLDHVALADVAVARY